MIKRLLTWLEDRILDEEDDEPELRQSDAGQGPYRVRPRPQSKQREGEDFAPEVSGRIEDGGPGKNVLIRNKYVREDTGTHDTLKIVDDSLLETDEECGIDPYNTGQFDRSKFWNLRTRK